MRPGPPEVVQGVGGTKGALHEVQKFGKEPNAWNEFILRAYHHLPNVIFPAGLPT